MIKAVIFDFDGTLSYRSLNVYKLYYEFFKPHFSNLDEMEFEALIQDMMLCDCNGILFPNQRLKVFKIKHDIPDVLFDEFTNFYNDVMPKTCEPQDDTIEVLQALKPNYKLGIITNGNPVVQRSKIKQIKIEEYFDEIMVSGEYDFDKPDPKLFEIMANKLNVKPEECLFVGDIFATDILGAYRAHMIPCWIQSDKTKPSIYKGYRIQKLKEVLDIVKKA